MDTPIVRSESLAQQVYRYLRHNILTGNMSPGERIVETRLAADLNTSRSPVREALRMLMVEGLVSDKDGNLQVFDPSFEDFRELYELRLALESEAARHAAVRITVNQLEQLQQNIEVTKQVIADGEMEKLIQLNSEFHGIVLDASGNRRFLQSVRNIEALINYYSYIIFRKNNMQTNIVEEHGKILRAMAHHDAEAGYHAMYSHIYRDLSVVKPVYDEKRDVR
ncbi:GntR family transcriptional regulator [Alicyclobacillus sp. SO9]|uniref:GntR family transcriptional regulator n=1 Tax=Alicyclobacillus sp. SO9 TaxID=2665646 RepID=UPI0018E744C3|nr:GntR family transcriptional regulator [Alicyclobacillus sp. SO9]QQE79357.1 GntR family transcriptional regulator [Alicyclobacillus sp. SO9]